MKKFTIIARWVLAILCVLIAAILGFHGQEYAVLFVLLALFLCVDAPFQ